MLLKYTVQDNYIGASLKHILREELYISTKLLNKLKDNNAIFVNGKNEFVTYKLLPQDYIEVFLNNIPCEDKFSQKYPLQNMDLNSNIPIIYEDEYILAVNKPINMPVHPCTSNKTTTLANYVASYLEKQQIYSVHILTRLDTNTSGVCIFAKNSYIHELFKRKSNIVNMKKEYLLVVNGIIKKDHDFINSKIDRKKDSIVLREVSQKGKIACTEYFVVSRDTKRNISYTQVILHTGRTHQIRVHMAHIGHPLLGDDLYSPLPSSIVFKYISRPALHASKTTFIHPISNKVVEFIAKTPNDINIILNPKT